jgi:hypothetical protein
MSPSFPTALVAQSPIFILGALRSGTTVFRLMLGFHEDISNLGEADFIFDHVQKAPGSRQWTYDHEALGKNRVFCSRKLTIGKFDTGAAIAADFIEQLAQKKQQTQRPRVVVSVHRHADKVAALFPDAKILHILRDPRDVAKSCIGMGWAGNTYFGIDSWLGTETNWEASRDLFGPDKVMEIRFEELIRNPQVRLEKVCGFLGLPFSPSMLNYHTGSTYEAPDPSAVEPWKKKVSPRDVALVEIKAKPLLLARKYELSGYPLDPPGLIERAGLSLDNKIYKWKFGCERFGVYNFVMEKVTRWFIPRLHDAFVRRINEITASHLK